MLRLGLMFMNMGIYEKEGGSVFTNRSERNPLCLDCWSKSIMNHHISSIWTFLGEEKGQAKSKTLDACFFYKDDVGTILSLTYDFIQESTAMQHIEGKPKLFKISVSKILSGVSCFDGNWAR